MKLTLILVFCSLLVAILAGFQREECRRSLEKTEIGTHAARFSAPTKEQRAIGEAFMKKAGVKPKDLKRVSVSF